MMEQKRKEVRGHRVFLSCKYSLTQKGRADLVRRYENPTGGEIQYDLANAFTQTNDLNINPKNHPNYHSY